MKITIVGAGYVGLSLATLFAQGHQVTIVDIISEKVDKINQRISPLKDDLISEYFLNKKLNLRATLDLEAALVDSDYVVIATPTDYDDQQNYFDTTSVEMVIRQTLITAPKATIIIRSTIPVGYTTNVRTLFKFKHIYFSPEFLREGQALYDNLYPSRIIIGGHSSRARRFANLLLSFSLKEDVPLRYLGEQEAEAVKLFANTYLAMRVSFFNELDTFAEIRSLDTRSIIEGVSLDPRIGDHYNNPSFAYGGYCLPKDTKQLLANYRNVPNNLIKAVVEGNRTRKEHIVTMLMKKKPKVIGIYRLVMKKNSENIRDSVMFDIIDMLKAYNVKVIIYEPLLRFSPLIGVELISNFNEFCHQSDVIAANRIEDELVPYKDKVYSRDIYHIN